MLLGGSQGTVKNSGSGFGQTGAGTQLHFGGREKNIVPLSAHFLFISAVEMMTIPVSLDCLEDSGRQCL